MKHAPSRLGRVRRRGLTFVEVIISVGVVAGAATLVLGTIGFLERVATHNRDRLNGMEVAHRVILTCMDDFKSMRGQVHRVEYDGRMYAFDVWEELLTSEDGVEANNSVSQRRSSRKVEEVSLQDRLQSQIHQITVVVYVEDAHGRRSERPVAWLVRSYNPFMSPGDRGIQYGVELMQEALGVRVDG